MNVPTNETNSQETLDEPISLYKRTYIEQENTLFSTFLDFEGCLTFLKGGKAVAAALLGTIVEWYDYSLYGYMSATLADHFFPSEDHLISLIKHFAVFALGFIAKPLGSLIFGFIGDGKGRKYALRWSILGIALPTTLIGFLPSYDQLGMASVLLLCTCRLIQGLFVSAETDGVNIFIYESLPKKYACSANSLIWISSSIGIGLASFVGGVVVLPQLPSWSWRLPFVLAGVLGLVVGWFRRYLIESIDYILHSANSISQSNPNNTFWKVIKRNKFNMLLAILLQGSAGGTWIFYFIFWNNYLSSMLHKVSDAKACFNSALFIGIQILTAPLCGYIADRLGTNQTIRLAGFLGGCMLVANGAMLSGHHKVSSVIMALTVITIVLLNVAIYVTMMRLFTVGERYRCMSLSRAFGSMLFSSTAPLVGTLIWQKFQNPVAPLFYGGFLLVMGFLATFFINKQPLLSPEPSTQDQDLIEKEPCLVGDSPNF